MRRLASDSGRVRTPPLPPSVGSASWREIAGGGQTAEESYRLLNHGGAGKIERPTVLDNVKEGTLTPDIHDASRRRGPMWGAVGRGSHVPHGAIELLA